VKLYLLRHAPALSREEWQRSDDLRPLSPDGEDLARRIGERIDAMQLGMDAILTSPYERALRTAVLVRERLGDSIPLIEDARLAPGRCTPDTLTEMLAEHFGASALMLVGHEPSMTALIASMVGGGRFTLKKCGLVRVDVDPASPRDGVLKLLTTPGLLK